MVMNVIELREGIQDEVSKHPMWAPIQLYLKKWDKHPYDWTEDERRCVPKVALDTFLKAAKEADVLSDDPEDPRNRGTCVAFDVGLAGIDRWIRERRRSGLLSATKISKMGDRWTRGYLEVLQESADADNRIKVKPGSDDEKRMLRGSILEDAVAEVLKERLGVGVMKGTPCTSAGIMWTHRDRLLTSSPDLKLFGLFTKAQRAAMAKFAGSKTTIVPAQIPENERHFYRHKSKYEGFPETQYTEEGLKWKEQQENFVPQNSKNKPPKPVFKNARLSIMKYRKFLAGWRYHRSRVGPKWNPCLENPGSMMHWAHGSNRIMMCEVKCPTYLYMDGPNLGHAIQMQLQMLLSGESMMMYANGYCMTDCQNDWVDRWVKKGQLRDAMTMFGLHIFMASDSISTATGEAINAGGPLTSAQAWARLDKQYGANNDYKLKVAAKRFMKSYPMMKNRMKVRYYFVRACRPMQRLILQMQREAFPMILMYRKLSDLTTPPAPGRVRMEDVATEELRMRRNYRYDVAFGELCSLQSDWTALCKRYHKKMRAAWETFKRKGGGNLVGPHDM